MPIPPTTPPESPPPDPEQAPGGPREDPIPSPGIPPDPGPPGTPPNAPPDPIVASRLGRLRSVPGGAVSAAEAPNWSHAKGLAGAEGRG